MKSLVLFVLLSVPWHVLAAGPAAQPAEDGTSSDSTIDNEFGMFNPTPSGIEFKPAKTIPLVVGQSYGWYFGVDTIKPTVTLKEVFELPVAPKTWGGSGPERTVSKDGKTCTTMLTLDVTGGYVRQIWSVVDGDPPGKYVIRVYMDGDLLKTFHFTLK